MEGTPAKTARVLALDRLRALCVISMLLGHLMPTSLASRAAHVPLWVDGAMGFVLVSGIVFGIVRRSAERAGASMSLAVRASWRRACELWSISIAIALFGFALGGIPGQSGTIPPIDSVGSLGDALSKIATLQVTTKYADVLIVYIWFLLLAPGILWMLRRKRHGALLASAAALGVYLLDVLLAPGAFRMTEMSMTATEVIAADNLRPLRWFIMFVAGIVGGWHWSSVQRFFVLPRNRRCCIAAGAFCVLVAQGVRRTSLDVPAWLVDKGSLGPLAIAAAFAVYSAIFAILLSLAESEKGLIGTLQRYLGRLGRKSLAAYVVHIVVVYVASAAVARDAAPWVDATLLILTIGVTLVWEIHDHSIQRHLGPFSRIRKAVESLTHSDPLPQPSNATL